MRLSRLAPLLEGARIVSAAAARDADPELHRACLDSRRVQPGDLFCALRGAHADGARYVNAAAAQGARAVLVEEPLAGSPLPQLVVAEPAFATGRAAAELLGRPADALLVLAVTGTNGKTTVVHLLQDCLEHAGLVSGRCGTLGLAFGCREIPAGNTTPPADVLQEWFAHLRDAGAVAAVLEASSHGLVQGRLAATSVDVAGWTNLSHDHLDYHRDLDDYAAAKARLFEGLDEEQLAFLPVGDARIARACRSTDAEVVSWGLEAPDAELRGSCERSEKGLRLAIEGCFGRAQLESALVGEHNAENLLLAFGLACAAGLDADQAAAGLARARGAPGRLERVAGDSPWRLYVDYAHTPEAIARALAALRAAWPGARLGIVFGAGGDRDPSKRAPMGAAAAGGADWCLVTSDNPRHEDPQAIVDAVAQGVREAGVEPRTEVDRRLAIRSALAELEPSDVLLVAGKGHEDYQEVRGERSFFDDRVELEEAARCRV